MIALNEVSQLISVDGTGPKTESEIKGLLAMIKEIAIEIECALIRCKNEVSPVYQFTTIEDKEQTRFLLEKFVFMKAFINNYEEFEEKIYNANKEGEKAAAAAGIKSSESLSADVLHANRLFKYQQFRLATTAIMRSVELINDDIVKKAITLRFIEGHAVMVAVGLSFMDKTTFRNKVEAGIGKITEVLKNMGILELQWMAPEGNEGKQTT